VATLLAGGHRPKENLMPRTRINVPSNIEHIAILSDTGEVDAELEPDLSPADLLGIYRTMLLVRRFDERMLNLQRQGRIGTFPPVTGQEAAHLGAVIPLRERDWMVPAFRELAAVVWRGGSLENFIIYNNGFNEGAAVAAGSRNLPICVPVASQIPHAVGLAWAAQYRRTDEVVLTFFGDGATSEGDFHEGMNFASVYQVPVVFLCQNNHWAISVPVAKQTRSQTIAQKALAYGMPGIQVDGNDILAVYVAAREAVERARSGGGPTLIESVTYRMAVHTTADDPKRYRSEEEVARWKRKDPIARLKTYLTRKGVLTDEAAVRLEEEVKGDIQSAVERAEKKMASLGDALKMFEHVYAEMPPYLRSQRDAFEADQEA
jgi:pyruvate dehydrogenase E1 component alpha subunit